MSILAGIGFAMRWMGSALARVPWQAWAAVALLLLGWLWGNHRAAQGYEHGAAHERPLAEARGWLRGSDDQVTADGAAVLRAFVAANAAQQARIDSLTVAQATISKGRDHDLAVANDTVDRAAAQLRQLHDLAHGKAASGRPVDDAPVAVPGAAGSDDEAACTRAGGLSFDVALSLAVDAEHDAATLRQVQGWIVDQSAAFAAAAAADKR